MNLPEYAASDYQQAVPIWLIYLIIYAVTIALTYYLTPKPEVEDAKPAGLGDFNFPTATEGRAIPVVWGTNRIRGPNVVWYGDLSSRKIEEDDITIGYTYFFAMDFAICFGPVNSLTEIEIGQGQRDSQSFVDADINTSTNIITFPVAHEFSTGDGPLRVTSTGTLPGQLNANTKYWSRAISTTQLALYTSKENAKNDVSKVDLNPPTGTGTHTLRDASRIAFSGNFGGDGNTAGNLLTIDRPKFFGGRGKGGGMVGQFRFYDGVPLQQKNAYLVSQLGQDVPAYVDICHGVWERGTMPDGRRMGEFGETPSIPVWAFTVERYPDNLSLTGTGHIINDGDANPAEVLYEVCTNNRWGLGRPSSTLNFASFQAAGNTLKTEGNGFSGVLDREQRAEDFVTEILKQIDGSLYQDQDGLWTLTLARADYTIGSLPLFDETNIIEVGEFTRGSWESTVNDVSIEFFDRTDDFKDTFAMGQDIANFNIQGGVRTTSRMKMPGVKFPATAKQIAEREIRTSAFPHAKVSFVADRTAASLVPGGVARFSWPPLGIVQMPIRIITVNRGELLDGRVSISAVQDIFGLGNSIYAAPPGTGWTTPITAAVAFSATQQHAFDAPRWFDLVDPVIGDLERVFAVGARPSGAVVDFRLNVDAGAGYLEVDVTGDLTPAGVLDANYAENTSDVDASSTLVVASPTDFEGITAATAARIEALGANLIKIDDEILAFESASFSSGTGKWTLNNVHRGLLDTLPAAHSAGARVWVLRPEVAVDPAPPYRFAHSDVGYAGTASLNVKLLPETATDLVDLSAATAIALSMSRRTEKPLPVGNFRVTTTVTTGTARYPVIVPDGDVTIAWNHRHRNDPKILDQNDGDSSLGLDTNTTYEYTWFVLDSGSPVQVRQATQTTTSFAYTRAQQTTDNGAVPPQALRARLRSKDTSLTLDSRVDVVRDFEVFDVQPESVDLDGSTEGLMSNLGTLGIADAWSCMFWMKRRGATTDTRSYMVLSDDAINDSRVVLRRLSGQATDDFNVFLSDTGGTTFKNINYSGLFTADVWHQIVVTYNGAAGGDPIVAYIDGAVWTPDGGGTDNTGTQGTKTRHIALAQNASGGSLTDCRYHSAAIWSSVLSAAEVTAIYNGGNGSDFNLNYNKNGYVSKSSLVQWFRLGRDSSPDADIGKQYALTPSGTHNVMDAATGITAADVVTDAP